ncbi:MAG: hypothetical protein ABIO79_15160 [Ferruginibacter sp.]
MTMKIITTIFLFFIIVVGMIACVIQPKVQYYNFPEDIAEEAKIAYTKKREKGRVLYNINCAKCHTKKIKRSLVIPDFTTDQLDSYIIRIKNETHVANLKESTVSPEEMEAIQFFFTYKKPGQPKPVTE